MRLSLVDTQNNNLSFLKRWTKIHRFLFLLFTQTFLDKSMGDLIGGIIVL